MRRREFVALLSGAVVWPLAARAQQRDRMRRIGVLTNLAEDDPVVRARLTAFLQGLQELGWTDGRNIRIDTRWGADDPDLSRRYAAELIALVPDLVLAATTANVGALQQATRTVPIVFAGVSDPVGAGLVASLARPGGNTTGFSLSEYGISVKWLELLKQIAPRVSRVAVIQASGATPGIGQLAAIQAVAPSFGAELTPLVLSDAADIERAITGFGREPNGGLIVTTGTLLQVHRDRIIALAARHQLPAVYPFRVYVGAGGLISYGPDLVDQFRRAAGYVDRILKGEKPADLPVQAPTKYELAVNLKTAKALGIEVPPSLLARADEVIE
jgi:putative tryptophan/tyrosine transport system substrate-binding protein